MLDNKGSTENNSHTFVDRYQNNSNKMNISSSFPKFLYISETTNMTSHITLRKNSFHSPPFIVEREGVYLTWCLTSSRHFILYNTRNSNLHICKKIFLNFPILSWYMSGTGHHLNTFPRNLHGNWKIYLLKYHILKRNATYEKLYCIRFKIGTLKKKCSLNWYILNWQRERKNLICL